MYAPGTRLWAASSVVYVRATRIPASCVPYLFYTILYQRRRAAGPSSRPLPHYCMHAVRVTCRAPDY